MDFLDPVFLSRAQFTFTVLVHFIFVPLSVGLGLAVAIFTTRAARTGDAEHERQAAFLVKLFSLSFACGVATGITMEFSFGTNWADYSRFVGDIFGAPLAAEALLAFFLESTFLGVLVFGRGRVGKKLYVASAWLVWAGSALSALWIVIANSWMQSPRGYAVDGATGTAQLTDFLAAAFNPETLPTYAHTLLALVIMGAFTLVAIACWHKVHGRNAGFVSFALRAGAIVALVACVLMMPVSHWQAVVVAEQQPTKLAAMEGQYETGAADMTLFGYVDTENKEVVGPSIPGLTSFLATGDFSAEYPGLDELEAADPGSTPGNLMVQATFASYHTMLAMMALVCLGLLFSLVLAFSRGGGPRWMAQLMRWGWVAPLAAIMAGWMTAEFGRQPWIVYGVLKTADAYSKSVPADQVLVTLAVFVLVYAVIVVAFARLFTRFVHEGPQGVRMPHDAQEMRGGFDARGMQGMQGMQAPYAPYAPYAQQAQVPQQAQPQPAQAQQQPAQPMQQPQPQPAQPAPQVRQPQPAQPVQPTAQPSRGVPQMSQQVAHMVQEGAAGGEGGRS